MQEQEVALLNHSKLPLKPLQEVPKYSSSKMGVINHKFESMENTERHLQEDTEVEQEEVKETYLDPEVLLH